MSVLTFVLLCAAPLYAIILLTPLVLLPFAIVGNRRRVRARRLLRLRKLLDAVR